MGGAAAGPGAAAEPVGGGGRDGGRGWGGGLLLLGCGSGFVLAGVVAVGVGEAGEVHVEHLFRFGRGARDEDADAPGDPRCVGCVACGR